MFPQQNVLYFVCSTSWIPMVISHFTWLLKKMAMPTEFSCLTAMQWVRKPSLHFLNAFYFYGHSFANILFSSPVPRCDVPANPCPDVSHHWRNSRLLHGSGPNTRACCPGVYCSRILTLLQTTAGFCLLAGFVLSCTYSPQTFLFFFLADWTAGHATLLVFGLPVVPLRIQERLGNLPAGGWHASSWDSPCTLVAVTFGAHAWIYGFRV